VPGWFRVNGGGTEPSILAAHWQELDSATVTVGRWPCGAGGQAGGPARRPSALLVRVGGSRVHGPGTPRPRLRACRGRRRRRRAAGRLRYALVPMTPAPAALQQQAGLARLVLAPSCVCVRCVRACDHIKFCTRAVPRPLDWRPAPRPAPRHWHCIQSMACPGPSPYAAQTCC
jgi:hypothetical protein